MIMMSGKGKEKRWYRDARGKEGRGEQYNVVGFDVVKGRGGIKATNVRGI